VKILVTLSILALSLWGGDRFMVQDNTIYDSRMDLQWQGEPFTIRELLNYRKQLNGGRALTWKRAKKYCDELFFDENSDWRLPTLEELKSLRTDELNRWVYLPDEFLNRVDVLKSDKFLGFWSSTKKRLIALDYSEESGLYKSTFIGYTICVRDSLQRFQIEYRISLR
jgi:hypothetical protein